MTDRSRVVLAAVIGNVVEWYDFGLYGLMAPTLASLFFPSRDRIAALLGVYGGFAVGFAMRPIGAVVLGRVGDRRGRQFVLVLSVALMGAATVAIGVLPSYETVGIWAAVLLIVIRLFQGFSVGGEFVGSVTYLVETAHERRRGLAGSVANIGATIGMLLAAALATLAAIFVHSAPSLWRIPFLVGGALAGVGYLLRKHLPPEEIYCEAGAEYTPARSPQYSQSASALSRFVRQWPALEAFRRLPRIMIVTLLFTSGYGISNYLIMVFLPTFAREFATVSEATALRINTIGQGVALAVIPLAGWLSDRRLRRRTILASAFLLQAAVAWVLFRLVTQSGTSGLWIAQLLLAGLLAIVMGVAPSMLAEQFPRGYRVSAHAIVLNVGIGIAGGTAPMIAVALISATGERMAPAAYLMFACVISGIAALLLNDRSRLALDQDPTDKIMKKDKALRTIL